jgi:hypothetical protein
MQPMKLRKMPAVEPRVETGPLKFGDDWTGVFIRGDDAMFTADMLRKILEANNSPMKRILRYLDAAMEAD